jgi:hypothetical protein
MIYIYVIMYLFMIFIIYDDINDCANIQKIMYVISILL